MTISGLIDTGYQSVNAGYSSTAPAGNLTASDYKGLKANGTATSVLTIAGTEDLGNGLAANFQFQLTPDFLSGNGVQGGTTNNTAGDATYNTAIGNAQQAFVGLSSAKAGSIKLGRVNSNALDAWGTASVFGTALGSGYGSNGNIFTRYSSSAPASPYNSAPTRFNNAIRYESPAFSGFSGSVLYVPQVNVTGGTNTADTTSARSTNRQGVTDIGLKYSNGPLNVMYANQKVSTGSEGVVDLVSNTAPTATAANVDTKLSILAANYTFGAATVYGATWTEKQNSSTATNAAGKMIGAKYALGATTLMASMGSNNDKTSANADKKISGFGADYALSKRTNLYARYEVRDADTTTANDDKTKTTAIGVRHSF